MFPEKQKFVYHCLLNGYNKQSFLLADITTLLCMLYIAHDILQPLLKLSLATLVNKLPHCLCLLVTASMRALWPHSQHEKWLFQVFLVVFISSLR
jgi:hypothetical protein